MFRLSTTLQRTLWKMKLSKIGSLVSAHRLYDKIFQLDKFSACATITGSQELPAQLNRAHLSDII